jgi:2-dehydropantoate 2-reductase
VTVAIVGAGAVGSLLAARLARAGGRVILVGRPAVVAAVRERGLRVEGEAPALVAVEAVESIDPRAVPDAVLVAVKTYDLEAVARAVADAWATPMPLLLPQNGLHVEEAVVGALRGRGWASAERYVVRAVSTIPAMTVAPGVVRQPGTGEIILRDPARSGAAGGATETWRALLAGAGVPVRTVPDLDRELWRKALVNAAINPVTAEHRVPNGRLLESPYREEARTLLREAQRAAAVAGHPFDDAEADRDLDRVVRATAGNRSSMLQDVERGRPTEIDAISGEIDRTATAAGIALPATRAVVERLDRARRGPPAPAQPF